MKNDKDLKIFIVDDDPFCRSLYQQHLCNIGYKNNFAFENGIDCINQLVEKPDVILLDYDMAPNGIEVLKMIRQQDPNIYLLVVSSRREMHVTLSAIDNGAFDYIQKDEQDLERISKVINNILTVKTLGESYSEVKNYA